jgi:hypothetical protein
MRAAVRETESWLKTAQVSIQPLLACTSLRTREWGRLLPFLDRLAAQILFDGFVAGEPEWRRDRRPVETVLERDLTFLWRLEAALKCRSCRTPRSSPPVHMIRLTEERQTAPYVWVHPDEER